MSPLVKTIIAALAGMIFLYAPFLWCRCRDEDPISYGLSWQFDKKSLAECLAVTAAVLVPLTIISLYWPVEQLPRSSSLFRSLNLAAAGGGAAVIEEVFFRGWIQPLFRKKFRAFWTVVLTSAIFAASHVFVARLPFLVAVFFPGCVMGILRERHGNISTSTLFHFLGNIWAIWFAPLIWPNMVDIRHFLEALL